MRYFLLLCKFRTFFWILPTVFASTIDARFGEKKCSFHAATFHRLSILCSRILVLLHSNIPYIIYNSHCLHICQNYLSWDCEPFPWSCSSYVWLFVSSSDDRRTSENPSRETSRVPWRLWVCLFCWIGQFHENFGWLFFLWNLHGCWFMDGCRSEGVQF